MYSVSEIGPAGATGIFRDRGRALGGHCDFARSSISSSWSYYRGYGKLTSALCARRRNQNGFPSGITAGRDEPEPESDGYDASLEAMFD